MMAGFQVITFLPTSFFSATTQTEHEGHEYKRNEIQCPSLELGRWLIAAMAMISGMIITTSQKLTQIKSF